MSLQEFNGLKRQAKEMGIPYSDVKQCNLAQLRALVENWEPATEQPAIDPEPATEQPAIDPEQLEQPDFHTPARSEWAARPTIAPEPIVEQVAPVREWAAIRQTINAELGEFKPAFSDPEDPERWQAEYELFNQPTPPLTGDLLKRLGLPLNLESTAGKMLSEASNDDLAQFGLKYVHHHGDKWRFSLNGVEKTMFGYCSIAALLSSFELDGNLPN